MKALLILIGAFIVGAIVGGLYWLIWQLWLFVLPQIWPAGPAQFVNPGFWLFAGAWFLVTLLGRSIFNFESRKTNG